MVGALPNCLVCGAPLVYAQEARDVACAFCGARATTKVTCENGHYVCDGCHRDGGVEFMMGLCTRSQSRNAVEILQEAMADKSVYPNGPEHHTLVGAAIITAFCNAGGRIQNGKLSKEAALQELKTRSLQVPGGACGYWGCCGAATSAGQALSVINGSTPLAREAWGNCQRLTSNVLGQLADQGGPRCCKRSGFTAVIEASRFINERYGGKIEIPDQVTCAFFPGNAECLKSDCPYFPKRRTEGA